MIKLSYTSLNNLHNGHEWVNKQLGIPVPDYPFLNEGKEAHRIIQKHLSGEKRHKYLSGINVVFPIVEAKDFDDNCRFSFPIANFFAEEDFPFKNNYEISGFIDGHDPVLKRMIEIKTSSNAWSMAKFRDSMQRKLYASGFPDYEEQYIITGSKDPEKWKDNPPKLYSLTISEKDRAEAMEWILKGIQILEKGDFTGGLDENGKCTGCFWNMDRYPELANCHFM